jgi:hypothetical protein
MGYLVLLPVRVSPYQLFDMIGGCRGTRTLDPLIKSQRISFANRGPRRKMAVTQLAACHVPTSANATLSPQPSGTVQRHLCGKFVGNPRTAFSKLLISLASPTGFEPVLPP